MGAWGSGSFENDTALDWAASVQSVDDVRKPFERLKQVTDESEEGPNLIIDADFACELVAAAETVAMMLGRHSRDFPEELARMVAGAGEPDNLLFHQARNGALYALRNSELAELWEEAAEEGGTNPWIEEMTRLFDRLNPELEFVPPESEEIEQRAGGPVGLCAFCNQPIEQGQLWGMNIHDYTDAISMSRGLWFHLPCLNARMHHKHAIADLKFDPDNLPDLDKL